MAYIRGTPEQRFWYYVKKTETCWLWTASTENGYGQLKIAGKMKKMHRFSWELHNGPIPSGLCICHHCDVRACVRPDHLFLGTRGDNNLDKLRKGRGNMPYGETHPSAKLSVEEVQWIREEYDIGETSQQELADRYNVHQTLISAIVRGRVWKILL